MFAPNDRSAAGRAAEPASDAASGAGSKLAEHAGEILALTARLARLRAARRRLGLARGASTVLAGLVLAVVCVTAAVAGARLGVRGLTGAFASVFRERTWLAELSSGLVLLGSAALLLLAARAVAERRILRELRRGRGRRDAAP